MLAQKDRSPVDQSLVNLNDELEARWWCTRFGCTEVALRRAVGAAGPSAAAVEHNLKLAAREALKNTGED